MNVSRSFCRRLPAVFLADLALLRLVFSPRPAAGRGVAGSFLGGRGRRFGRWVLLLVALLLLLVADRTSAQTVTNGGFESGLTGWTQSQSFYPFSNAAKAHGGSSYAYFGTDSSGSNGLNNASGSITQSVTLPLGPLTTTLDFYLWVASDEGTTSAFDFLYVDILNNSGTLLNTIATYSNQNKSGPFSSATPSYQHISLSLAAYFGQTIKIRFRGTTDVSTFTIFRLDDVSVNVVTSLGTVHLTVNAAAGGNLAASEMNAVLLFQASTGTELQVQAEIVSTMASAWQATRSATTTSIYC